jgi:hypothetical protein
MAQLTGQRFDFDDETGGKTRRPRLRAKCPNIVLVLTPVRASWLSQIKIYFFPSSNAHADRFCKPHRAPRPADAVLTTLSTISQALWGAFTRSDLDALLEKLRQNSRRLGS